MPDVCDLVVSQIFIMLDACGLVLSLFLSIFFAPVNFFFTETAPCNVYTETTPSTQSKLDLVLQGHCNCQRTLLKLGSIQRRPNIVLDVADQVGCLIYGFVIFPWCFFSPIARIAPPLLMQNLDHSACCCDGTAWKKSTVVQLDNGLHMMTKNINISWLFLVIAL